MVNRTSLGNYSCRLSVQPSDTITAVFDEISNFLTEKGWTRVSILVNETAKTGYCIFSIVSDGTEKQFTLRVAPKKFGSSAILGVVVVHNNNTGDVNKTVAVGHLPEEGFETSLSTHWTSNFVFKLNIQNNIYIFASSQWALFIGENSEYGIGGVPMVDVAFAESAPPLKSWKGWHGTTPFNSVGRVNDYLGTSLEVPSEYNYFRKNQYHASYMYFNGSYPYFIVSKHNYAPFLSTHNRGLVGCVQGINPNSGLFNCYLESATLLTDGIGPANGMQRRLNARRNKNSIPSISGDIKTSGRICGLQSNASDYRSIEHSKLLDKNPWNRKNAVSSVHVATESNQYQGQLLGLKLTQSDKSFDEAFLNEVWISVDENWNFDSSGTLQKFYVVPGGCEHQYRPLERNWVWFNAEHALQEVNQALKLDYFEYHGTRYFDEYWQFVEGWAVFYHNATPPANPTYGWGYWKSNNPKDTSIFSEHTSFDTGLIGKKFALRLPPNVK